MALKDIISDLKKQKWKNLKRKEKKFYIGMIFLIIIPLITYIFLPYSEFSRLLKFPKEFNEYVLNDFNIYKIYIPNKFIKLSMEFYPNAKIKAYKITHIIMIIEAISLLLISLPIKLIKEKREHGSARWGTFDDLTLSGFLVPTNYAKAFEISLLEEKGVVLGEVNGRILRDNSKTHILLSAPTRTGKGVSVIIPTLVDTWNDSVFVLDIKGENYQMTAGWRQKNFNNTIFKFSPLSIDSCSFNPLEEVRYLTANEIDDAKIISQLIVIDEGSSDPFWGLAGSDLCTTLILYELYKRNGKANLSDVVKYITDPSEPLMKRIENSLSTPIINDEETKEKLLSIYTSKDDQEKIKKGFHPFVSRGFADTLNKGDKTLQSIIATAKSKLSIFESPNVERNTSKSDFKIQDLMAADKPISLYIVVPPGEIQNLSPLLRILIIQCVQLLTPEMDYTGNNNKVKFKHRLLMLLDEFPSIGKMEILEKGIGYVAGYGMKMMIVVQSLDQLNKIYTKDNMFLSNCQTQVFYTANENQTAEYVSKSIGTETILVKSKSGSGGIFSKNSYTESYQSRDLLKPEEFRRFPLNKILLLIGGKPPIISNKVLFFKDKRFKDKVKLPIEPTEAMKNEIDSQLNKK